MTQVRVSAKWFGVCWISVLALVVLIALPAFAQLPTATILGTVKDSTGGAVAGATITVTDTDTGVSRTGPTTDDGSFRFPALQVGHYAVKIEKEGFEALNRTGLTLNAASDINLMLTLQVGATTQTVEVTGEAPLVDTTTSSIGNLVNDAQVTDLPLNGRNWTDLTLMQPGVTQINAIQSFSGATGINNVGTPGYQGTLYSTNGGTDRSNMFLLDGADERGMMGFNNTSITGTSLGVDGIQEYKVVSVGASAEYGLVTGSQTVIVSKGGTNQWHGDAFDYLRNDALDAEQYNIGKDTSDFNASQCGAGYNGNNDLFSFPCKRNVPFQRNNFGGAVGGPIQKDKTFFYAVFEGIQQRLANASTFTTLPAACFVDPTSGAPVAVQAGGNVLPGTKGVIPATIANNGCVPGSATNPIAVPSVIQTLANYSPMPNVPLTNATRGFNYSAPYTQPTSEEDGQIRIDRTFSAKDSVFFRYTQDDASTLPDQGDPRALNNDYSTEVFATLSETHIFSPSLLNTARLSFSRNLQNLIPIEVNTTIPGLPNEPVSLAAGTLFVDDQANVYDEPGSAGPGAIPQLLIPGCTPSSTSSACYSTYSTAHTESNSVSPGFAQTNDYTFSDDLYWTKGKHAFKFGTLMNRFDWWNANVFQANGSLTYPGSSAANPDANTVVSTIPAADDTCGSFNTAKTAPTSCPLAAYFENLYTTINRALPNAEFQRFFRHYTFGFYAQDDYKVVPRLTLNLGFRYEFATVPHELLPGVNYQLRYPAADAVPTEGPMFLNPSLHNFDPRFGFAWDVFGTGKTSLRGSAGIYADIATYGNPEQANGVSTPPYSGTLTYTDPNSSGKVCCVAAGGSTGQSFANVQPFTGVIPTVTNGTVPSPRGIDYNLQQPTLFQRSLGIDQQLPGAMALSVSYVGAKGWHLYQLREGDPVAWYAPMTASSTCNSTNIDTVGCPGVTPSITTLSCSSAACLPVTSGSNGLPFFCSPADGTSGPPSAAHPCFNNAATIPCTTSLTAQAGNPPSCPSRINSVWNGVPNVSSSGNNYYNSLQVLVTKRTTHGLQFQASYTWQKLLDTGTSESTQENGSTNGGSEYPGAIGGTLGALDRGPSNYNATNGLRGSIIYRVPSVARPESILGKFVNGWGFSAIPSYQSGYPLSIGDSGRSLDAAMEASDRVSLCPGYQADNFKSTGTYTGDRSTSTFFNLNMVCLQPAGTLGNSAKGFFTGPAITGLNTSFTKDTKARFLGEAGNIQFRFDMFNVLNHPDFAGPSTTVFQLANASSCPGGGNLATLVSENCGVTQASGAGTDSLTTVEPMRQMQVSLRLVF